MKLVVLTVIADYQLFSTTKNFVMYIRVVMLIMVYSNCY